MDVVGFSFFLMTRDVLFGLSGLAFVLLFHGFCLSRILLLSEINAQTNLSCGRYNAVFFHVYVSFTALCFTHICEIFIWGTLMYAAGLAERLWDAIVCAGSCYTTLGMVPNILPNNWRSLWFIIAFSGLFSLAWSTSAMTGMMKDFRVAFVKKHQISIQRAVTKRQQKYARAAESKDKGVPNSGTGPTN